MRVGRDFAPAAVVGACVAVGLLLAGCPLLQQARLLDPPPSRSAAAASTPGARPAARSAVVAARGSGIPAFPDAEGWGATARGARGCAGTPRVLVVDTLEDQDDGGCDADPSNANCSLRDALSARGPRYVLDNAPPGLFALRSRQIRVVEPCVTLNFSTAPSPHHVANGQIQLARGFREGIFRYVHIAPGHEGIDEALGRLEGCNTYEHRCSEPGRGRRLVPSARRCEPGGADACGPGSRCLPFEQSEIWRARRTGTTCPPCSAWRRERPGDFSGCNDVIAKGGDAVDTLHFEAGVEEVIVDHATLVWACDEAMGHLLNAKSYRGGVPDFGRISVTRSIIGNGVRSDGERLICHREKGHNLGPLFNGDEGTPSERVRGYTLARNYLVNNERRIPKITGGSAIEIVHNLVYNGGSAYTEIRGRAAGMEVDVVGNVYRHGPDSRRRGAQRFNVVAPEPHPPRVFLEGNLFLDRRGVALPASPPGAGADERERTRFVRASKADSPSRGPVRLRERRLASPRYPVSPADPATLAETLLADVGASLPCRSSLDRALVAAYQRGTGYVQPGRHPRYRGRPHGDRDADGLADAWEAATGVDDPLADPDGDGYPNVEEWLNGSDPRDPASGDGRRVEACLEGGAGPGS